MKVRNRTWAGWGKTVGSRVEKLDFVVTCKDENEELLSCKRGT